jgi:SAM-dependent methyltransferase
MKEMLTEILRCPICGKEIAASPDEMVCSEGHRYSVVRGVPRLFEEALLPEGQLRTAAAFGYTWTHYPKRNPYTEEQCRDWIVPLTPGGFRDKRVLDAGCGLGGFAEYALGWGAREVVGVDLSDAVGAARARLDGRIELIQADLHRLPFAPRSFDLAYSIGVLHHLPDPERGFHTIAEMVRPGGDVFAWVYGRENNGWIVHIVNPLRRLIFSRMPRPVLKWGISLVLALILVAAGKLALVFERMPYGDYLRWLGRRDLQFAHGVVVDHLVAPTSHYIRREEFEGWFEGAGLTHLEIRWRNRNSWAGLARVPESSADRLPGRGK